MIIIAESGATKTDWCAICADGRMFSHRGEGMNVSTASIGSVEEILRHAIPHLNPDGETVREIHFYSAGIINQDAPIGAVGKRKSEIAESIEYKQIIPIGCEGLDRQLREAFPEAEIEYASDMLAAARAVCGHHSGIAAIIGTGSNTCLYDGEKLVRNIRSGGFILGDEGGAARLGRIFLSDFIKGLVPEPVASAFAEKYASDYQSIVQNVYKGAAPARYLGSLAPFIASFYNTDPYIKELIDNNFRDLITRCLLQYFPEKGTDFGTLKVGVVGSFGAAFEDTIVRLGAEYGIRFTTFMASPMEGLVKYHIGKI